MYNNILLQLYLRTYLIVDTGRGGTYLTKTIYHIPNDSTFYKLYAVISCAYNDR